MLNETKGLSYAPINIGLCNRNEEKGRVETSESTPWLSIERNR